MLELLKDMLLMLGAAALLWLLHLNARVSPDGALIAAWALITFLIAGGLWWRRRIRRRAFLSAYIEPVSILQTLLRGGFLMALLQIPVSMLLAGFLMIALIRQTDPFVWAILMVAAPALVLVRWAIARGTGNHVSGIYLPEFSLRLTFPLLGLPLLVLLIMLSMRQSYPDFTGVGLERAVWHLVGQEQARSQWLLTALQIAAAGEALRLWLAQQLLPALPMPVLQWLGWVLVFVREAVFVWSYLLLMQGILLGGSIHARR